MLKTTFFYLVGLVILGMALACGIYVFFGALPYIATAIICLTPLYGAIRKGKNWNNDTMGMKTWFKKFMKVFKFGKPSITFYLILGVAIAIVHSQIISMMLVTIIYAIGGCIVSYLVWEGVRLVLAKIRNVQLPSFKEAVQQAL